MINKYCSLNDEIILKSQDLKVKHTMHILRK